MTSAHDTNRMKKGDPRMTARFSIAIAVLCLAACNEQTQPSPSSPSPDPYEQWRSLDLHNYTIDQIRSCFCAEVGEALRVTVRFDTIASVAKVSDGSEVPYQTWKHYLTVDSLFGVIRNPGTDSLVTAYHPSYGFPQTLDINPQLHPVDGGVLYQTSNLQIP